MKIVVVRHKVNMKLYPFTLNKLGEIIITYNRDYNLDDLIVSLQEVSNVEELDKLDNRYFVMLGTGNGQKSTEHTRQVS